jgi:NAD(P)-dependent dehydrogenase (short-subunit alcohol dehydrogenase family)
MQKVVFVTGCDSGFGAALVRRLASTPGYAVIAGCLTADGCAATLTGVTGCFAIRLDVTQATSIRRAVAEVQRICDEIGDGTLHALVNNAGILSFSPVEWQGGDAYRRVMDVNFHGAVDMTLACLPLLREGAGGRVVNVCSVVSHLSIPFTSSYCASKAALLSFSDGLRRELRFGASRVSVHCIVPGFFATGLLSTSGMSAALRSAWQSAPAAVQQAHGGGRALERVESTLGAISLFASSDMQPVVDAMAHAVTSVWAREVYRVGADARTVWPLVSAAPAWLADLALSLLARAYAGGDMGRGRHAPPSTKHSADGREVDVVRRQQLAHGAWALLGLAAAACCHIYLDVALPLSLLATAAAGLVASLVDRPGMQLS